MDSRLVQVGVECVASLTDVAREHSCVGHCFPQPHVLKSGGHKQFPSVVAVVKWWKVERKDVEENVKREDLSETDVIVGVLSEFLLRKGLWWGAHNMLEVCLKVDGKLTK